MTIHDKDRPSTNFMNDLLERDCQPQPEGDQAQPVWKGRKVSEFEQKVVNDPAFDDEGERL